MKEVPARRSIKHNTRQKTLLKKRKMLFQQEVDFNFNLTESKNVTDVSEDVSYIADKESTVHQEIIAQNQPPLSHCISEPPVLKKKCMDCTKPETNVVQQGGIFKQINIHSCILSNKVESTDAVITSKKV